MKTIKKELSSYTIFGVFTTAIAILSYKFFLLINISYIIATTLSTVLAVVFAYITNRKYVFKSKNDIKLESFKFLIARFIIYLFETALIVLLVTEFKIEEFISKILVTILVIVSNYLVSKFIIFRDIRRKKIEKN